MRQDGIGKPFWHSRRTPGRNRPKRRLPGLMSPFRHTAEPLPQPSARATQPSLQQKADKADHRDAAGYPSGGPPIRYPKTKGSVPAYTEAEPFLGLVGASKHIFPAYAGEPVRQDGIGKSFWHSRRTGTEPSKAQASGLDEPLPAYGGTSSLTIGTRYAQPSLQQKSENPPQQR